MGTRKPKPTALKERTSVRSNLGLSRLFSAANALVSLKSNEQTKLEFKTVPKISLAKLDEQTMKLADLRQQEDQAADRPDAANSELDLARTRATNVKPLPAFNAAKLDTRTTQPGLSRTSITKLKKSDSKKRELSVKTLALCFLIPALGLFTYVIFSNDLGKSVGPTTSRQSELSPAQIKERLSYHSAMTGAHLNRQRIDVQIQNYRQAPDLAFDAHKVKPPNMMDGLPLVGEQINSARTGRKDLPYDPTYSEAHIAYGLQEQQGRIEFERQSQKQWVKDFVENARKDGYDVKIDEFGNVKAKEIPLEMRGPLNGDSTIFSNGQ